MSKESQNSREITKYSGLAGQFKVMAELAIRGYNVASPSVDIGDDVLVINENTGKLDRIQVKTARPRMRGSTKGRFIYEFLVYSPRITDNLSRAGNDTYFIFVLISSGWPKAWDFVILPRTVLNDKIKENNLGGKLTARGQIKLNIEKNPDKSIYFFIKNKKVSLSNYTNNWSPWPALPPYDR